MCAPALSGVSVSPSPVELLQSSPSGLQSQMLWGLLLPMPDPSAGEPNVRLRALSPVGDLLQYNYSPVCGSPSQVVWDLIILRLLWFLLMSLDVEYLFVVGLSFIDGCSAVSCDFGVLVRGGEPILISFRINYAMLNGLQYHK